MNRYANLKISGSIIKALGLLAFVGCIIASGVMQDLTFAFVGFVTFIVWFAVGEALLVLADIAQSVRASATVLVEQAEVRQAKINAKPKSKLNLKRLEQERSA